MTEVLEPKKNDTPTVSIAEANATLTAPGQIFEMEIGRASCRERV